MATFAEVFQAVTEVKDAISAGHPIDAWQKTFPLQQFAIDAAHTAGFQAGPGDAKVKANIATCLRACESLCHTQLHAVGVGAPVVGVIGDGKILQLILTLITTLLPLFT